MDGGGDLRVLASYRVTLREAEYGHLFGCLETWWARAGRTITRRFAHREVPGVPGRAAHVCDLLSAGLMPDAGGSQVSETYHFPYCASDFDKTNLNFGRELPRAWFFIEDAQFLAPSHSNMLQKPHQVQTRTTYRTFFATMYYAAAAHRTPADSDRDPLQHTYNYAPYR